MEMLPDNVFVAFNKEGDQPICSMFLVETNTKIAWITFPVSDKLASVKAKDIAFEDLFEEVEVYGKSKEFKILFTTSGTKSIKRRLLEQEYELGDENVDHFLKLI